MIDMMHISVEVAGFSVSHACTGKSGTNRRTLIKNAQENATNTVCDSGPCRTYIPKQGLEEKSEGLSARLTLGRPSNIINHSANYI